MKLIVKIKIYLNLDKNQKYKSNQKDPNRKRDKPSTCDYKVFITEKISKILKVFLWIFQIIKYPL